MYFKRLEMHGFKSFAEPVVIEFHEGVTCIVGPNGSGKSNISDAIRWVLGEQSPKALRGGKMEEVIFNGTASRKSRGMAEVTLVIDNSTGILDIDYNEVAITRRMFRSGESEYLINNNQCRLRDIRELIMDTGIGVDGYSIIGQGKIADIVSNKPESRREIFEEAAGVVLYKSKKAEAERKLDSTNNNLERVNDIIGEIEGRIGSLREDSIKAQEYLKLKDRYKDLEINITLKNIDNIENKNLTFKNDIKDLADKIIEITTTKEAIDQDIEKARNRSEALDKLGNDARDKLLKTVEEINKLTNQSQLNEERLSGIEKDNNRINDEIENLVIKLEKENQNKENLLHTKKELKDKYEEASTQLQNKIERYSVVTKESADSSEKVDNGKNRLFKLHSLVSSKQSEVKSIENLKDTLAKRKNQVLVESSDIKKNTKSSEEELVKVKEASKKTTEKVISLQGEKKHLILDEQKLISDQKNRTAQIEELRIRGSQLSSRKKTIEEMENNYEGYNFAVKFIMKSKLSGIKGVVADLMDVPSGYEVAIETALGGAMQNIICDNDNNAKNAVNALKQNKAGRSTFLPVSSIRGNKARLANSITSDAGFSGIAVDCVNFQNEFTNVFEYLLGRVAIVDNMDTAVRLSKIAGTAVRFVTLDGEIINASGAITGGKYKNKTANLLERKSEIAALEEQISEISNQIINMSEMQKADTDKLEKVKNNLKLNEKELRDAEIALAGLESSIASLANNIKDINTSNDKYNAELNSIEKELTDADNMITSLEKEIEKNTLEIDNLNDEIEIAISAYEESKEIAEGASEEITQTRIAANEWSNKLDNLETLLKRVEETANDYEFQIEHKKNQIKNLQEEKNSILFGSGDSEADTVALDEERRSLEVYISEVAEEKNHLNEKVNVISKDQQSIGENLNSYQDQKYQLEIRLAKNDTQLDTLKEKLWEDFEISYMQALDFKKENFVMSSSVKESREIRNRMRELGDVNVGAIREYQSVSERYKFLTEQRYDITTAMDELQKIIDDMDTTIKVKFKENFDQVVVNFEDIFKELFGGGHAELRMEDENNPLESGIDIIAQPPGKKLQNINLLSGGEKTMTAIALMFAVLKTKPTPFCILDEVEAALDDANIDRFSNYLRKFYDIQFALVTHQKATMEHADVLYGVTMPEQGISKVLSLRLGDNFEL